VLREVANLIHGQLREYDFLARNGGDEFVALVQEVVGAQVEDLCMRIESAVSKFSLPVGKNRFASVGISIGTSTFAVHGETLDQLVVAADNEMYRMKSNHRSTAPARSEIPMSTEISN
jgi:two-component system, cell cycle response regulator